MNIAEFNRLIMPLKRRVFSMLGRGIVKLITASGKTQTAQITILKDETISEIERLQDYGLESYPKVDAEAYATFLNGNREQGVVLVVHDRRYRPQYLGEGDVVLYSYLNDNESASGVKHRVWLKNDGTLNIESDGDINIDSAAEVNVDGATKVTVTAPEINLVSALVNLSSATRASLRRMMDERFISLFNNHVHDGVQGGVGSTNVPTTTATTANHATDEVRGH